jgi:NtrC-family two-component system response regulator AlgB
VGSNQTITVDARVIAATNKKLDEAVSEGKFREDLYYRLNIFECMLVSIRHRREDLPVFIQRFAQEFYSEANRNQNVPGSLEIPSPVMDLLLKYNWPGNIREIRNVMERLVLLSAGRKIMPSDLPLKILEFSESPAAPSTELFSLEEAEKRHIEKVLKHEPNLDKASEILGITKVTLWRRRKEYGLA